MENLTVETQVIKNYKFMNTPVIGDGVKKLDQIEGWLLCNWEGEVTRYSKKCPEKVYFVPADKGGMSVFGLDKHGMVIVGMAIYQGDPRSQDPIERTMHVYCKCVDSTKCWY